MHAHYLSAQSRTYTRTRTHAQDTTGWRIPIGRGIAGECASTGETFNIRECYEDARFNQKIDRDTGVRACF
jgi:putative methionine-R-sulfoxide reductase with GAF domain